MYMELGNMLFGNSRGSYRVERTDENYLEFERLFNAYSPDRDFSYREYGVEFENDTFWVMPYWWGDCTCGCDENLEDHELDCKLVKPNFFHKSSGLEVSWYKYPLRDAYSNVELSGNILKNAIDDCIKSLNIKEE